MRNFSFIILWRIFVNEKRLDTKLILLIWTVVGGNVPNLRFTFFIGSVYLLWRNDNIKLSRFSFFYSSKMLAHTKYAVWYVNCVRDNHTHPLAQFWLDAVDICELKGNLERHRERNTIFYAINHRVSSWKPGVD